MRRFILVGVVFVCALDLHCARRAEPREDLAQAGDGNPGGAGSAGVESTTGTSGTKDLSDIEFVYDGPAEEPETNRDTACATSAVPAQPVPLDMYLMVDRSVTMREPLDGIPACTVGDTVDARWCYAINALAGFFQAPTSNGLGVALGFFPHGTCGWNADFTSQDCCTLGDCCQGLKDAVPDVGLGELPSHLPALVAALDDQDPLGTTTPIEAAIRGLVQFTAGAKRDSRQMVAVLVTDGEPNGCERDPQALAELLQQHRDTTEITTFVVGVSGANFETLEILARAGGAEPHESYCASGMAPCVSYDVGDGRPEAFVDALQQIHRSVVGCQFTLPQSNDGLVDPDTLVVEVSSPAHTDVQRLERLGGAQDCGEGWYADPDQANQFALCPSTCSAVTAEVGVRVDVLAGCLGS